MISIQEPGVLFPFTKTTTFGGLRVTSGRKFLMFGTGGIDSTVHI